MSCDSINFYELILGQAAQDTDQVFGVESSNKRTNRLWFSILSSEDSMLKNRGRPRTSIKEEV